MMRQVLQSSHPLDALIQSMGQGYGVDVSAYARTFLQQTMDLRRSETGCLTVEAYLECLATSWAEGQEAWSIAILLDTLCGADSVMLPYRMFASDLFEADLAHARDCVQGDESASRKYGGTGQGASL